MKIKVVLVEDHHLIRRGLTLLLENLKDFEVLYDAVNGDDFLKKLESSEVKPDIVLMDVNMPIMNGEQTTRVLSAKFPDMKIIALSVNTDIDTVRAMIKAGAHAYLFKDAAPELFQTVINKVHSDGYYYDKHVIQSLIPERGKPSSITHHGEVADRDIELLKKLSAKELTFLNYSCTEATYKEIADSMGITVRTVDGYRESLFAKLEVRSRIGLVIFAIKTGVFKIY